MPTPPVRRSSGSLATPPSLLVSARGDSRRGGPWTGATDVLRDALGAALTAAGLPFRTLEPLRPSGQVWRAQGGTGAWVVRVASPDEVPALEATLAWAATLARAGVAVPSPWMPATAPGGVAEGVIGRAHGDTPATPALATPALVRFGTSAALVNTWAHGTPVAEGGWDDATAAALGRLLADAHTAAAALPNPPGARRYDAGWAEGAWRRLAVDRAVPDVAPREATVVRAGLAAARVALDTAWHGGPGGPVVMVHADVHAHNVLVTHRDGDEVGLALIDAGQVGLAPVLLDLAFALLEHEEATAWAFWRGYQERRPLPPEAEQAFGAMHVLALVDNLAFLAADEREHAFVAAAWPALVASCAALVSSARAH